MNTEISVAAMNLLAECGEDAQGHPGRRESGMKYILCWKYLPTGFCGHGDPLEKEIAESALRYSESEDKRGEFKYWIQESI
jgi:hypothetical protein